MKDSDELPSLQDEEQDDAVIGRALRGSIWVFAGLLFIGVMVWVIQKWPEKKGPEVITEISVPTATQRAEATVPKVRFTDQTRQSGITFKHVNGAYGDKLLPETMGSGVAVLDYDQDGAPDLFFVNARYWDDHLPEGEVQPTHQLYRNLGNGQFEDVTDASGLAVSQYGMGVSVGDVNNDGWPDLFVSGVGGDRLFRNSAEGRFEDVTELAGVGGDVDGWSTCSAFFDADNDGDLDLVYSHINERVSVLINETQNANQWLSLRLIGQSTNRAAVGSVITLTTAQQTQVRQIKGGSSYASTSDSRVFFGIGQGESIETLTIGWPDGSTQTIEAPDTNTTLTIVQPSTL